MVAEYYRRKKYTNEDFIENEKDKKEYSQEDFLADLQLFKFYVSIYYNEAQFQNRLVNQFNLTKKQLQKYSEVLESMGLITFQRFTELDAITQEIIYKIEPDPKSIYNSNPKMYIITPNGSETGKELINKAMQENLSNQGVQIFLSNIQKQSRAYHTSKTKILYEENTLFSREVIHPVTGQKYIKDTKNKIETDNFLLELRYRKKNNLNISSNSSNNTELAQLDNSQKQELELFKQSNIINQKRQKVSYNGMYSNLTGIELDELSTREVSPKEVDKLNKDIKKERDERYNDDIYYNNIYNINNLSKNDKEYIEKEAEDYLNSL